MKTETQVFADGTSCVDVKPLSARELEKKIYELADVIAELINASAVDVKDVVPLQNRLEEIKRDLD